MTFPRSDELRATVAAMPRERLILETDAPYLAPVPLRGKRNEPAFVAHTAKVLAQVLGLSVAETQTLTTANALGAVRQGGRGPAARGMKVTVLGSGTSSGVPLLACDCPVCTSPDPRNRRRRASILIEARGQTILVDTGPDLRDQLLGLGVKRIDAVLYTHAHADHVHGIDDMRAYNNAQGMVIPAYAEAKVFARIRERFDYAFHDDYHDTGFWRPALRPITVTGAFRVGDVPILPIRQRHGRSESWGFRIGDFAYSTDTDGLDEAAFAALGGLRHWIVDALREEPHPSHAHLAMTLGWIERARPQQAWLTHMSHEAEYHAWCAKLPAHIRPAHDGLALELDEP